MPTHGGHIGSEVLWNTQYFNANLLSALKFIYYLCVRISFHQKASGKNQRKLKFCQFPNIVPSEHTEIGRYFKINSCFLLVLPSYSVLFVFFAIFSVFQKPENSKIKLHFQNTTPYFCKNPDLMLGGVLLSDWM